MTARAARSPAAAEAGATPGSVTSAVNEVRLRGRLGAAPEQRVLPSGDTVVSFRVVVDRPDRAGASVSGARVDTIDCSAFRADVRRRCLRWAAGDVVQVDGSLRRRFFRTGGGPASRYDVEVLAATRVARAPAVGRVTMAG
jgi:single-strand DNA-binding protein